jgi:eukaryotic-like serine/threonine-protein kinase
VRDEQAVRGRAMVRLGLAVSTLTLIALQLPGTQDPTGRLFASLALGLCVLVSGALTISDGFGSPADPTRIFVLGLVVTPTILIVLYHLGPFSPAVMALFVGIYYFGLADDKRQGWVIFLFCALGYLAIAVMTTLGVLPQHRALFAVLRPQPIAFFTATFVVEVFLTLTFWMARLSRRATRGAMARLEHARLQIDQRDALLQEARADLQNALAARRGRYSDRAMGGYVAEDVIGRGAMGEVYRARHVESGVMAALKVLHPWMLDSRVHVERFFREAEISGGLDSPHVVKVYGHGTADDGTQYLAMELLNGHDLGWHLRERTRLSAPTTVELVDQLAQALNAAWDAGIVHRDLKPKNIFLHEVDDRRIWKILDFGVSKLRHGQGTLTAGEAVGTPAYMAPEQAAARDVDHRADVFSLGAITYRVLTGRPAFAGADVLSTMYMAADMQPLRPGDLVPLPTDVDLVIALALAKNRDRRIRSASTFAAALRDAMRAELDERFRQDAENLLEDHPWGTRKSEMRKRTRSA